MRLLARFNAWCQRRRDLRYRQAMQPYIDQCRAMGDTGTDDEIAAKLSPR